MDLQLVYATFPDEETAKKLARAMLEERLAACATFWPAGSLYWWDGEIEEAEEHLALFKTSPGKAAVLVERLTAAHPYDVPCVLPLEVDGAPGAYRAWVEKETLEV